MVDLLVYDPCVVLTTVSKFSEAATMRQAESIGELARRLGTSKSFVWKSIRRLRLNVPYGPGGVRHISAKQAARIAADYREPGRPKQSRYSSPVVSASVQ